MESAKLLAQFARGIAASLLVMAVLVVSLVFVGMSDATTDASIAQLYVMAGIYAVLSWSALAYTLFGDRESMRWAALLVPVLPALLLAFLSRIAA